MGTALAQAGSSRTPSTWIGSVMEVAMARGVTVLSSARPTAGPSNARAAAVFTASRFILGGE